MPPASDFAPLRRLLLGLPLLAAPPWARSQGTEPPRPLRAVYTDIAVTPYMTGTIDVPEENPGIAVELVRMAAAKAGVPLELVRVPQHRIFAELRAGTADAGFSFSYRPERARDAVYPLRDGKPDESLHLLQTVYVVYRRKGSTLDWDGNRFLNLDGPIGVNTGWSIGGDLTQMGIDVEEVRTTEQNFGKLRLGRIAGFAVLQEVGDAYLTRHPIPDVEKIARPISVKPQYIIFNRHYFERRQDQVKRFWTAVAEVRNAHSAALYERYANLP